MKVISPLYMLVLATLLAACGGATPAPTEPPVQPATQDAPLEAGGTRVDITLADNTIDASQTEFQVGVPYTFVIVNMGEHPHNFNISKPVAVAGSMNAAFEGALLAVPQDQLDPGESVTVDFTFPESAAGQLLEFSCLIRRHYDDGMLLEITVSH